MYSIEAEAHIYKASLCYQLLQYVVSNKNYKGQISVCLWWLYLALKYYPIVQKSFLLCDPLISYM